MKKSTFLFSLSFVLCTYFFSSCNQNINTESNQRNPIDFSKCTLVEDFNSSTVDSSLWETAEWTNGGMFNCGWKSDHVSYNKNNNGLMIITMDNTVFSQNGKTLPYTSGEFRSIANYGYGYYEVKMKPCKYEGTNSSFFLYSKEGNATGQWNEIDIEFLGKDTTKVQFNYYVDNKGEGHEFLYDLGFDASEDFHIFGIGFYEDSIKWYVDGKLVYSVGGCDVSYHSHKIGSLPNNQMQIMANFWSGIGVNDWLGNFKYTKPLYAQYDYIAYIKE